MFSNLNSQRRKTKFNYIPRYFDQKNQNVIYRNIGDGQFAQNYIQKKYSSAEGGMKNTRIDFSSYRNKSKMTRKKSFLNLGIICFVLSVILFSVWVLTEGNLTLLLPTND